jgi:hypothetical protein
MGADFQAQFVDGRDISDAGYLGTLDLSQANGYVPQKIQIVPAAVREVTAVRSDANGTSDRTAYFGAGGVALDVALYPEMVGSTEDRLSDAIKAYLRPNLRPYLRYRMTPADDWRLIRVRSDGGGAFGDVFTEPSFISMSIGLKAPDGIKVADTITEVDLLAGFLANELGRTYDLTYDRTYPFQAPQGQGFAVNLGNVTATPLIRLYGPCTNPILTNQTVGKAYRFTANGGVTLAVGEFLEVDVRNRTVRFNGDATQNRYQFLDAATLQWWGIEPGSPNTLQYSPVTSSGASYAQILFRSSWAL